MNAGLIKSIALYILELLFIFIEAFIIAMFIMGNIGFGSGLVGQSMEPNFTEKNRIIANRLVYLFRKPKRNEVVVIDLDKDKNNILYNAYREAINFKNSLLYRLGKVGKSTINKNLLKRVIAIEGDLIDIEDGNVILNNKPLEENYILGDTHKKPYVEYPIKVPENKVFVLGDNRENSLDSRNFGLVDLKQIKGKVVFKYKRRI